MARSSRPARRRSGWRMATMAVMAILSLLLLYQLWLFCMVVWYAYQPPGSSAVMRGELSRLRESDPDFKLKYDWVPYDRISESLKRAVVASEDANFVEHDGVEWEAIRKASSLSNPNREMQLRTACAMSMSAPANVPSSVTSFPSRRWMVWP